MKESYEVPILFLIFNRPECTKKTFEAIKKVKPKRLFVAADGPRKERVDEVELCKETKEIIKDIDWECEIKTLFRDENLGCGHAVSSAITWFFQQVDMGVILEDDCLPLPGFFEFCGELLEYYKDDEQVFEITGTNLQSGIVRGNGSYYFSNYGGIWGWATWARAWNHYDFKMTTLSKFVNERQIEKIFKDTTQQKYWIETLTNSQKVDTWDYQWLYTHWNNMGLCIVPNVNLIQNIGFNSLGTHTINEPNWYKQAIKSNNTFNKIVHPKHIMVNIDADNFLFKNSYNNLSLLKKTYLYFKKILFSRSLN